MESPNVVDAFGCDGFGMSRGIELPEFDRLLVPCFDGEACLALLSAGGLGLLRFDGRRGGGGYYPKN